MGSCRVLPSFLDLPAAEPSCCFSTQDAAFIAQALVETGLAKEPSNQESLVHLLGWLDKAQIQGDRQSHFLGCYPQARRSAYTCIHVSSISSARHYKDAYRQSSKGAWPFSTPQQSYLVTDTTSEALKAVLGLQELESVDSLSLLATSRAETDSSRVAVRAGVYRS